MMKYADKIEKKLEDGVIGGTSEKLINTGFLAKDNYVLWTLEFIVQR